MKKTLFASFFLGFLGSCVLSACLAPGAQPATGSDAAVSGDSGTTAPAGSAESSAGGGSGGGEEPIPGGGSAVPGPVARADGGGIVGAPSSREGIQEAVFKVKMLYWKPDARRPWRDAADFFEKLNRGALTDEVFAATEGRFLLLEPLYILEEQENGEWGGYLGVDERMVRTQIVDRLTEPGYYLVFMAIRENFFEEKAGPRKPITTVEEARAFVNDPEARFVGERFIPPFGIYPEILRSRSLINIPVNVN